MPLIWHQSKNLSFGKGLIAKKEYRSACKDCPCRLTLSQTFCFRTFSMCKKTSLYLMTLLLYNLSFLDPLCRDALLHIKHGRNAPSPILPEYGQ